MGKSPVKRRHLRKARLGTLLGAANAPEALTWLYGETDKGTHGYLPHYRRHLGPRRWHQLLVFEIGVGQYEIGQGGSLPIWRDYLLRSRVVGIDIDPKHFVWGHRVAFHQADQSDPSQLQAVIDKHGHPDVVIDDGSHVGDHVVTSFRRLWPNLKAGGLYVIEDLATSYAPQYGGAHPAPTASGVGLVQQLVSDVQAADPGFAMHPELAQPPLPTACDVAAVHVYPGVAFVEKK
jgi:hypothetical protein